MDIDLLKLSDNTLPQFVAVYVSKLIATNEDIDDFVMSEAFSLSSKDFLDSYLVLLLQLSSFMEPNNGIKDLLLGNNILKTAKAHDRVLQLINSMTGLFSVYYTQASFAKNKDPLSAIFNSKIGNSIHEQIGSDLYNHLMTLSKAKNSNNKKSTVNSDIYSSGEPISQLLYYSICSLKFSSQPADKVINSLFKTFEGDLLVSTVASILTDILLPRSVGVPGWKNSDKEIIISSISENIFKIGGNPSLSLDDLFVHLQSLISQKTKYGLKSIDNEDSSPTEQSLSDFFFALNISTVKNFFFKTEWSKSFKLKIMFIFHNWNFNNLKNFDLLAKNQDGSPIIPILPVVDKNIGSNKENSKTIYSLEPVTLWSWELQLENLSTNESNEISKEDLARFNECTKEAFTKYPEHFISSLLSNMKFFKLLTDNSDIFEEYLNILYTRLYAVSSDSCLRRLFVDKLPNKKVLVNKIITSIIQHQTLTANLLLNYISNNKFFDESFLNFKNYLYAASYKLRISGDDQKLQARVFKTVKNQLSSSEENINFAIDFLKFYKNLLEKNIHYPQCKIYPENQFLNLVIDIITSSNIVDSNNNEQIFTLVQFFIAKNYTMNHNTLNPLFAFKAENPAVANKSGLFFRDLYSGKTSVNEAVTTVTDMLNSSNEFDNEFYAHLIGEVASEVDYFKEYPEDALKICANFIGEIIKADLITGVQLKTFKHCMLKIIEDNVKLQNVFLLNVFVNIGETKIKEFGATYFNDVFSTCKSLRENTSFRNWIETLIAPKTKEIRFINPTQPDNFVDPSVLKLNDKVTVDCSFVLNNVSKKNIPEMATSLKRVIGNNMNGVGILETVAKSISQRIKQDSNYHTVYRDLVYEVNNQQLIDDINYMTLLSAKNIFSSSDQSTQDKNLLKNLGNWLGLSFIAKGKIISHDELAIRELLLESWQEGYTNISIPFICKILSHSRDSELFQIPNLWTVSILAVLKELNEAGSLAENSNKWPLKLTFEVEVLFKNLKLSEDEISKSNWLDSNVRGLELLSGKIFFESNEMQNSEKLLQNLIRVPVMNIIRNQNPSQVSSGLKIDHPEQQLAKQGQPHNLQQQMHQTPHNVGISKQHDQQQTITGQQVAQGQSNFANQQHNDSISTSLVGNTMFVANPDLQVAFQMAIAKAVREILLNVVEKSAAIAAATAKALVSKDFATEPDPELFKNTCIKTARQLAKSSAYINSSSLLKKNIESTTKQLCANVMTIVPHAEEELLIAINDNVDVAIAIIETAAMDKATSIVSDLIIADIAVRHHHINRRSGQKFYYNESSTASKRLPEALSLNENGITQNEFNIYDSLAQLKVGTDFSNGAAQSVPMKNGSSSTNSDRQTLLKQLNMEKPHQSQEPSVQQASGNLMMSPSNMPNSQISTPATNHQLLAQQQHVPHHMIQHSFEAQLNFLTTMIEGLTQTMLDASGKPIDQEVIGMVDAFVIRIVSGISTAKQKDNIALSLSQTCVSKMFQFSNNQLMVVVFTKLIQKICIISPVAKKDVNWWLVYSNDALKMNSGCLLFLIKIGLLEANQLDTLLSGLLKSDLPGTVEFVLDITNNIIRQPILPMTKTQLVNTITLLNQIEDDKYKSMIGGLFNDPLYYQHGALKVLNERDRYSIAFIEWVNLCESYKPTDLACRFFIGQLLQLVDTTDKFIEFFIVALEISIEAFKKSDPSGNVFNGIDALAFLVVNLTVFQNFKSECVNDERMDFLKLVSLQFKSIFTNEHSSTNFNERPFFRFVSIVMTYWQQLFVAEFDFIKDENVRAGLMSFNSDVYSLIADVLHLLQPLAFPGFTFAWISLLSHRMFLPIMLKTEEARSVFWKKLNLLFIDLFKFFIEYSNLGKESVDVLYKGTLRFMLLIANDCPDYFISNHYILMNELPENFHQLRNIICSAIPLDKFFPDPMNQHIPIDYIPESCEYNPPCFVFPTQDLASLKKPVDSYLRIPSSSLLRNINNQMLTSLTGDLQTDFKFINSIVSHIVIQAGDELVTTSKHAILNLSSSYYILISNLITSNIQENKSVVYNILESLVNHLRFPNTQTYFVWYLLTTMFKLNINNKTVNKKLNWDEDKLAIIQEMILRALLKRLLIHKPHPWGCVVTLISILKNNDIENLTFMKSEATDSKTFQLLNKISHILEMPVTEEQSVSA